MIDLRTDGDVTIVTMTNGENRFSPDMLGALEDAYATVATTEGPRALVTVGTGKFFSNGLDLDWLGAHTEEAFGYLHRVHLLFAQVLTMGCPTVAALNGHTFAAGAMLSLCHDHKVMRTDRGYWCLPEVDLQMTFTGAMNALIPALLPARTAHEAMVTGRRYTADQAHGAGIVDEQADEADVLARAVDVAQQRAAQAGPHMTGIRSDLYADVLAALRG